MSTFLYYRTENTTKNDYKNKTHRHNRVGHSHLEHYRANETYINHCLKLLSKSSSSDLFLEVGNVSYPFEFILPNNLPTSFEYSHATTRYTLTGNIDIPW